MSKNKALKRGVNEEEEEFFRSEEWKFAKETIRNVFVFIVIACAAMGLELIVKWMDSSGSSRAFVVVLTALEYGLFGYDVIWFISKLSSSLYKSIMNTIDSLEQFKWQRECRKRELQEIIDRRSNESK